MSATRRDRVGGWIGLAALVAWLWRETARERARIRRNRWLWVTIIKPLMDDALARYAARTMARDG